ncbi:MAG: ORF6N domain-containing protein [Elusimicrobiota bacterium]
MQSNLPTEAPERHIYLIRGQRVMLDGHLAELYGVRTKNLNKAVNRNLERFPQDFMFQLSRQEYLSILRFQTGTLEQGRYSKYLPHVFTEQGVAMLSSVLRSKRAVHVNVGIMRAFVKLRRLATSYPGLGRRLDELESKYDVQFKEVFAAIRSLMAYSEEPRRRIGFKL